MFNADFVRPDKRKFGVSANRTEPGRGNLAERAESRRAMRVDIDRQAG